MELFRLSSSVLVADAGQVDLAGVGHVLLAGWRWSPPDPRLAEESKAGGRWINQELE